MMDPVALLPMHTSDHGDVPVDSGRLLVVDPCHLPARTVAALTAPNDSGVRRAVLVATPGGGDGLFAVLGEEGALVIVDPHESTNSWQDAEAADDGRSSAQEDAEALARALAFAEEHLTAIEEAEDDDPGAYRDDLILARQNVAALQRLAFMATNRAS